MASVATFSANTAYVELTQYRYWLNEDLTVDTQYKIQPKYTMFLPFWVSIKKCCVSWNCSIKYNICTLSGMMKCICTRHETEKKTLCPLWIHPCFVLIDWILYTYKACNWQIPADSSACELWNYSYHGQG